MIPNSYIFLLISKFLGKYELSNQNLNWNHLQRTYSMDWVDRSLSISNRPSLYFSIGEMRLSDPCQWNRFCDSSVVRCLLLEKLREFERSVLLVQLRLDFRDFF